MKPASRFPSMTLSRDFSTSRHFLQRVWLNCRVTDISTFSGFLVKFHPQAVFHFAMEICHPALVTLCHTLLPCLFSQDDTHNAWSGGSLLFCSLSVSPSSCAWHIGVLGVLHIGVPGAQCDVHGDGVMVPFDPGTSLGPGLFVGTSCKASFAYVNTTADFHLPRKASSCNCMPRLTCSIAPLLRAEWPVTCVWVAFLHDSIIFLLLSLPLNLSVKICPRFGRFLGNSVWMRFHTFHTQNLEHTLSPQHCSVLLILRASWSIFEMGIVKETVLRCEFTCTCSHLHSLASISLNIHKHAHEYAKAGLIPLSALVPG